LSGVLSELKPGFLQIVFSKIRRRVHDNRIVDGSTLLNKGFKAPTVRQESRMLRR